MFQNLKKIVLISLVAGVSFFVPLQPAVVFQPESWFEQSVRGYVQEYAGKGYQTSWHQLLEKKYYEAREIHADLHTLDERYCDEIALFHCMQNPHSFLAIVWPVTKQYKNSKKIPGILASYGNIRYKKSIKLKKNGPFMLTKHAYKHEHWLGSWDDMFNGVRKRKERFCFPAGLADLEIDVYLLDYASYSEAFEAKHEIRRLFKLKYHAIHITDNQQQSISLARVLFNKNSVDFLNNCSPRYLKSFEKYLSRYKTWIFSTGCPEAFACADDSVRAAYGKQDCEKISFITSKINHHYDKKRFHLKNKHIKNMSIDDALYNPLNYFVHDEIKYLK